MYPRSSIAPSRSEAVEPPPPPQAVKTREAITSRLASVKDFLHFLLREKQKDWQLYKSATGCSQPALSIDYFFQIRKEIGLLNFNGTINYSI
jgi:hypothetical protein